MAIKTADLCWGQRYHWLRYQQLPADARHDAHIVANVALSDGIAPAQLSTVLDYLIRRHEALRTVFAIDAAPWPQQVVQPPARLPFLVATMESDGTPGPAEVVASLTHRPFHLGVDWPIRACVVTSGGLAKRLVVVLNHVAFDDWSLEEFRQEFETLLAALANRRRAALAPVTHQPADLARAEASYPDALGYWRDEVSTVPADVFARRRALDGPVTACSASLTSPSLLAASRTLAAQHQVWPSAVQLAAYAVTMAAYTESPVVAFRWLTSHRPAAEHSTVMNCMFSPTLVTVDLSDNPSFSEVIRRTAASVEAAQDHAYVPYDEVVELLAAESFRRGQVLRVESDLNFLSYPTRSCGVRRDRFTPNPAPASWAEAGADLYLRIQEWADGVTVGLHALSTIMGPVEVETFLRGWVSLVAAHADGVADLTVSQAAASVGFSPIARDSVVLLGTDSVDLAEIEALLCSHPSVTSASVSVVPSGLAAYVVAAELVAPSELRRFVFAQLYERAGVRCPEWFEVSGAGEVVAGDGRDGSAIQTEGSLALGKVVAEVNGLDDVRLAESYVVAGGRALRAPRVVHVLAELGWSGVSVGDLLGVRPLEALASGLRAS